MASPGSRLSLDRIGAFASAVCAVHCLLTGIALGLLSVLGLGFVGSIATDAIFFVIALTVGFTAIWHGLKKHHSLTPALIFVAGLVMFLVGHFGFGDAHDASARWSNERLAQVIFSVAGGLCIVLFHVVNYRLQKSCGCRHCRTGE